MMEMDQAREAGDSRNALGMLPASRAQLLIGAFDPGACAPGFMLTRELRA